MRISSSLSLLLFVTIFRYSSSVNCNTGSFELLSDSDKIKKRCGNEKDTCIFMVGNWCNKRFDPLERVDGRGNTGLVRKQLCECIASKVFPNETIGSAGGSISIMKKNGEKLDYLIAECITTNDQKTFYVHRGWETYSNDYLYDFYLMRPTSGLKKANELKELKYVGYIKSVDLAALGFDFGKKWYENNVEYGGRR